MFRDEHSGTRGFVDGAAFWKVSPIVSCRRTIAIINMSKFEEADLSSPFISSPMLSLLCFFQPQESKARIHDSLVFGAQNALVMRSVDRRNS